MEGVTTRRFHQVIAFYALELTLVKLDFQALLNFLGFSLVFFIKQIIETNRAAVVTEVGFVGLSRLSVAILSKFLNIHYVVVLLGFKHLRDDKTGAKCFLEVEHQHCENENCESYTRQNVVVLDVENVARAATKVNPYTRSWKKYSFLRKAISSILSNMRKFWYRQVNRSIL